MRRSFAKQAGAQLATLALGGMLFSAGTAWTRGGDDSGGGGNTTVSARLGGVQGIYTFLRDRAVPALLADAEIASFFGNLTESADDIEQCLALLLDHDLGGPSPHNGAVLADGHECRSSMTNIHRGRKIPDRIVTKFINIVGQQAAAAGIAPADIQAAADVLNRYRGGVRNK